jgi:hypothetical protein
MALFLDPDEEEEFEAFGRKFPGKRKTTDPAVQQKLTENARRRLPQGFATGGPMFPPMLGNDGQSLANNVMSAHRRENDSRVAQMREMRRIAASQSEEQMKYDYLLRKLEMEREQAEKDRRMQQEMLASQGRLRKVKRNDGRGGGWYTDYVA